MVIWPNNIMFLLCSIDGKKILQEIPIGVTFNFNIVIKSKIMYILFMKDVQYV